MRFFKRTIDNCLDIRRDAGHFGICRWKNDGQDDVGRGLGIVVNRLACGAEFGVGTEPVSGIWITIEAGEVGAGYVHANPVALQENVAGGPQVDGELVNGAGLQ